MHQDQGLGGVGHHLSSCFSVKLLLSVACGDLCSLPRLLLLLLSTVEVPS